MNLIKNFLNVPSGQQITLTEIQMWVVEWTSRYSAYSMSGLKQEYKVFPTKSEANHFADQLKQAFKLINYKVNTRVTVTKN